jgi:uroporphyrinogen III methyltransferase/synthase
MNMAAGIVYLVGAGPGDAELLTLKGQRILATADVVIHDRLANARLLRHCRPDAEIIDAGKRGPRRSVRQDEINALLIAHAGAGRRVCRLKGGDPFLFGRGGEEAEALRAAGIRFEVVPGVSSALAVPAYAGIPVTHRGTASTLAILTGHTAEGGVTSPSWGPLARAAETVVVLMGAENLAEVVARFLEHGRLPGTPAAATQWGSYPFQRTLAGSLATIVEQVREAGLGPPAVLVVGEAVRLRERLEWFENRPLFGRRVLVTRTREQASALTAAIEELGGEAVEFPVIRIEPLPDPALPLPATPYDWIVFTSANDVRCFFEALERSGRDTRAIGAAQLAAIGTATAAALCEWRLRADFTPSAFVAEYLVRELPLVGEEPRVLIPRAAEAPALLPRGLRERGARVDVVPVYRTLPDGSGAEAARAELMAGRIDAVTFTSSSTVKNFRRLLPDVPMEVVRTICIGPVTADTAREYGLRVDAVAEDHTIPGLVSTLARVLGRQIGVARAPAVAQRAFELGHAGVRLEHDRVARHAGIDDARPGAAGGESEKREGEEDS